MGFDKINPNSITKHPNGAHINPIPNGIVNIPPITNTLPIIKVLVLAIFYPKEGAISHFLNNS